MEQESSRQKIYDIVETKLQMKQLVYNNAVETFEILKEVLIEIHDDLKERFHNPDKGIIIDYKENGKFEVRFKLSGDTLVFMMHTNVFDFDKSHQIHKSSYVKEDDSRAYCGLINVYNFLSDSFKYNRINDLGYLVARIFVNKDNHFFVDGKRRLGFKFNDFVNEKVDRAAIKDVVESIILYCLSFDLLTPPYDEVGEVRVHEVEEVSTNMKIGTGKRLGFKFNSDDKIE